MMRHLVLIGSLALASTASAQSLPNVNGIKQTTNRAVTKTNAHTLAMTNADSAKMAAPTPTPSGTASATKRAEARVDTDRAHGVRATAAAARASAGSAMDTAGKVVLRREVFAYEQSGRRDPFVSLMTIGELRPMISDLAISGILIDPTGSNSIAVLRDVSSKEQYRVRVGQQIGRMRVARITQKAVMFTIEEFGYSRQQELAMEDSNQARTK
ncbi:MAG TPA: hypothetical protein VM076_14000 [Gemmatimonadaceae bacterium]|nr:hypothetical protein [Gemmatimonadaceae bacterium]